MDTSPLPSRGHKRGRNCYVTPAFSGVPKAKRRGTIRSGYVIPACLGGKKWAQLLRKCGEKSAGGKSEVATSILPSQGPRRRRKWYVTAACSGVPNAKRREKFGTGYLTPV